MASVGRVLISDFDNSRGGQLRAALPLNFATFLQIELSQPVPDRIQPSRQAAKRRDTSSQFTTSQNAFR